MMQNPYPEKIIVGDDIEVSNPEHDAWNKGYFEALREVIKRSYSQTRIVPLWLTKMAGDDLVNEALGKSSTPLNRYLSQLRG